MADLTSRQRTKIVEGCATVLSTLAFIQELMWDNRIDGAMFDIRDILDEVVKTL